MIFNRAHQRSRRKHASGCDSLALSTARGKAVRRLTHNRATMFHKSFEVRRLSQAHELVPLRADWNALASNVPFCSFEWLESWWRAYGASPDKELYTLAVFDSQDRLAGLAPWFLEWESQRGVIRFLGSGEVCSDYLTILCRADCQEEVTEALADWLCAPADSLGGQWPDGALLELAGVDAADTTVARLLAHLVDRGKLVHRRLRSSCWRVNLPADWESYLAMLSRSHRKQIRRLERNYLANGRAQLHVVANEREMRVGLETLARLHQRRRESLGDRGCFASPRFGAFHEETARRLLRNGNLRLAWLELDQRTVAMEYQVLGAGVVYAYQSGIEPDALTHEPGRLITIATLQQAIAEGRQAFDFLRGDEIYKAHWRAKPRPIHDIRVVADTPGERLRQNLWLAGGFVKSWIKKNLKRSEAGRPLTLAIG